MRVLFIVGVCVLLVACATQTDFMITATDADNIAQEYITESQPYRQYNGHSLQVNRVHHKSCAGCYGFTYQYYVNTNELPDNIIGFLVKVQLQGGQITETSIKEIHSSTHITSFKECVQAGYPVFESHPRQCRTANGDVFIETVVYSKADTTFCGWHTDSACTTDNDCVAGGCSGQVCQSKHEEPVITTCEFKSCYQAQAYGLGCGCINNVCQWG